MRLYSGCLLPEDEGKEEEEMCKSYVSIMSSSDDRHALVQIGARRGEVQVKRREGSREDWYCCCSRQQVISLPEKPILRPPVFSLSLSPLLREKTSVASPIHPLLGRRQQQVSLV